jgi:group I intron endonuclease
MRLKNYYSIFFLERELKKSKSMIYQSLLKNGYSKFSLEILEYCAASDCVKREQYYMDLFQPEYNILKKAGS